MLESLPKLFNILCESNNQNNVLAMKKSKLPRSVLNNKERKVRNEQWKASENIYYAVSTYKKQSIIKFDYFINQRTSHNSS